MCRGRCWRMMVVEGVVMEVGGVEMVRENKVGARMHGGMFV